MLIGLTGSYGAGKEEVAHYLETKGFIHYSLSDLIREELKKEKTEITRENLIRKGNQLREKFGPGVLSLKVLEKLRTRDNFVISSLRNTEEIRTLSQRRPDSILVYVDAPLKLRFQRVARRARENDPQTLEEFRQKEKIEQSEKHSGQQLHKCRQLAKIILSNDGTLNDLYNKVDLFLQEWQPRLPSPRPSWDKYFLEIARTVATRATCDRGRSGCVVVKDKGILCTGYVGSAINLPHCDEVGHLIKTVHNEDGTTSQHCVRTIHAEQNAIARAARFGISLEGATMYLKMEPCHVCAKMIINSGIKRVVCEKRYHGAGLTRELFRKTGVRLEVLWDELEKYEKM